MTDTLRALIRECLLDEARSLMGIDLTDLTNSEIEELENYISGYVDLNSIDSSRVRNRILAMQQRNAGRKSDVFQSKAPAQTTLRRPAAQQSGDVPMKPSLQKPAWKGKYYGQAVGTREALVDTGKKIFPFSSNGERAMVSIKEKQKMPGYWVWNGVDWVSDYEFKKGR